MAKVKLKKAPNSSTPIRAVKSIPFETVEGNKGVLKATVIGVNKDRIKKDHSNAMVGDEDQAITFGSDIIRPPLSQHELSILQEYSSELGPNIEAMAIGIEGFGQRVVKREMTDSLAKTYEQDIIAENVWVTSNVINHPNAEGSLRKLRKQLTKDREATGNAWMELVPSLNGKSYTSYNRIEPANMYITKADKDFTRITVRYVDANFALKEKTFLRKLRRFVQIVGAKKMYFKEFRDPRPIDCRNGKVLKIRKINGKPALINSAGEVVEKKFLAREVKHFRLPTSRKTPYGLPRYTGNIIAIKGSRTADEANILTQQNNNIPSMAVLASGGALTEGSIKRLEEFVDQSIKGDLNYSKFLILEGESAHDSLSGGGSMKVEIKPLTNDQHTDALWSEYDKKNAEKIRRSFRQPPVLVGHTDNLNRAAAQESERLAEKYVYNPEREDLDEEWNDILAQQGIRFHVIKTNSPNVTNDEDLVEILKGAEKTGGVTPRIAHAILEDILNKKLPPIKENDPDFDPDLPFSISVGKLARGMARSNAQGTLATTGQQEADKEPNPAEKNIAQQFIDKLKASLGSDDEKKNDFISALHSIIEEVYDVDTFGKSEKDFFKHEH